MTPEERDGELSAAGRVIERLMLRKAWCQSSSAGCGQRIPALNELPVPSVTICIS